MLIHTPIPSPTPQASANPNPTTLNPPTPHISFSSPIKTDQLPYKVPIALTPYVKTHAAHILAANEHIVRIFRDFYIFRKRLALAVFVRIRSTFDVRVVRGVDDIGECFQYQSSEPMEVGNNRQLRLAGPASIASIAGLRPALFVADFALLGLEGESSR